MKIDKEFHLGHLLTEQYHPLTRNLSYVMKADLLAGIILLQDVDQNVAQRYAQLIKEPVLNQLLESFLKTLNCGGRIFFTGCGATGRLSILLCAMWRRKCKESGSNFANNIFSVMAGGDFALIKSVESFEDYESFGRKQLEDFAVTAKDTVVAITEGGETSFVIGTAEYAKEQGADTYFVYNNPDDVLNLQRSQKILQDDNITKINLTTGMMAISGSTRMQATTIELLAIGSVLEKTFQKIHSLEDVSFADYAEKFQNLLNDLSTNETLGILEKLITFETEIYKGKGKITYLTNRAALDILTDTTERSPTFQTPPFRKYDDISHPESWAYVVTLADNAEKAWQDILQRDIEAIEWSKKDYDKLSQSDFAPSAIGKNDILKFHLHKDALLLRNPQKNDGLISVAFEDENFEFQINSEAKLQKIIFPKRHTTLNLFEHLHAKLFFNTFSTAVMVQMERVVGNCMIWVVPSNKKLIDRATRYISMLTQKSYAESAKALQQTMKARENLHINESPVVLEAAKLLI